MLFLDCGQNRIVFAADSGVAQWKEISSRVGHTIRCNVLAVPHHAGRSHQSSEELQWLFTQAIQPEVAVISVGTSNTHDHPREDVIEAIRAVQATILCTQITGKCCANLEALRPGVLRPVNPLGRSSTKRDLTPGGHSRNVACAGTVLVHVTPTTLVVDGIDQHQTAVDQLAGKPYGYPLCRPRIVRN